ncbi:MAG: hypothetical protein K2L83_00300 [Muribaculaceae bacterium]|nr:hypothetical protein [Muribaculaceae bacterium]
MLKHVLLAVAALMATSAVAADRMVVVGGDDGLPLAGATVLSDSGLIVGISDNDGVVAVPEGATYPLTVRSMGFGIVTVSEPRGSVVLPVVEYSLPEVTVSNADRPIRRIIWYCREYTTSATPSDTMQVYGEYMLETFNTDGKVKGYKSSDERANVKASRRYVRMARPELPDSVFIPSEDDETLRVFSVEGGLFNPRVDKFEETAAIRGGGRIDSVAGKHSARAIMRKDNGRYMTTVDFLSDHKGHVWSPGLFKLLGITMDFNRFDVGSCFRANDAGVYDIYDLLYSSMAVETLVRGKVLKWAFRSKDPVKMHMSIEFYPIEVTSHTVDEYKSMRKDKSPMKFRLPQTLLPEIPAAARLKFVLDAD